jgi:putative membrane protein
MNANYTNTNRSPARLLLAACLMAQLAVMSVFASDTTDNRGQFSSSDYKFAKKAACAGMTEVTLGKLAAQKSANSAVQQFGQQMARDHRQANQNLEAIASKVGATLPTEPGEEFQKEIDRLTALSGTEFDKAYVAFMVKAHKADEKEFRHQSEYADNADLKSFAATTLPMVQSHLKMAQDLDQTLKATAQR